MGHLTTMFQLCCSIFTVVVCIQGTYGQSQACRPANSCATPDPATCTRCDSGYHLNGNTCEQCSATMNECATCVSSSQCISCYPTTTSSGPAVTTCTGSTAYSKFCRSFCEATSICENCAVYTDDTNFLDCRCNVQLLFKCNFESDVCLTQSGSDDFDWTRQTGATASAGTGPTEAMCTATGYYFYTEPSPFFNNDKGKGKKFTGGQIAIASTAAINYIGTACLRFGLHMYGAGMGTLTVTLNGAGANLLSVSSDQGNSWVDKEVGITLSSLTDVLEFKAVIGTAFTSDISIDNVLVTAGACSQSRTCSDGNCNTCSGDTAVCTQCVYGYYNTSSCTSCRATLPYCEQCSDDSTCSSCENTFSFVQSRCRRDCDASITNCVYCTDLSMTTCEICLTGYTVLNTGNCGACRSFMPNCAECTSISTCTLCDNTFADIQSRCRKICNATLPNCVYCDDTSDMICGQCITGFAIDSNSNYNCTACNQLLPYCAECSDASTCTTCESTYADIQSRCRKICDASLPNCVYCADLNDTSCEQCMTGFLLVSDNNCTACNSLMPYCAECSNETTCTQCENTFTYIDSRCRKTCDASLPNCRYCSDTNNTNCEICLPGYTLFHGNCYECTDANCNSCPVDPNVCIECDAGYNRTDNCTRCNEPTPFCAECSNDLKCTTCDNTFMLLEPYCRKICNVNAGLPTCLYCADTNDTMCEQCLTGYTIVDTNCTACNQLMPYCAECSNATTCTACETGYIYLQGQCRRNCDASLPNCVYCNDMNDTICELCPTGFLLMTDNNCTACGSLMPNCAECSNETTCTQCESTFTYIDARCRKNCGANLTNCVYCSDTNDTECQLCLPGYTLFQGNCYECADPYCNTCPVDPKVCTACDYGYNNTNSCTRCNEPTPFCAQCSNDLNCTTCDNTFMLLEPHCRKICDASLPNCIYCNDTDDTICEQCLSGFLLMNDDNCTACRSLMPYCAECSSVSTCTACENTFTYLQSRCRKICDASSPNCLYCADTNDTKCEDCLTGYTIVDDNCTACNQLLPYCAECSNTTTCTACESTFTYLQSQCRKSCNASLPNCVYCDDTNDMICQQCQTGYAIDSNSNCTACNQLLPYCAVCSDTSTCTSCENTFSYMQSRCRKICDASLPNCNYCDDMNDTMCQQCQTEFAIDNEDNCTACNQLMPYCAECSNATNCTTCENTYNYIQSRCRKTCDASLPNCVYCDDTNDMVCQQCVSNGYAVDNYNNCTACNQLMPYCAECSNATTCTTCESTYADIQSSCRKICDPSLPNCVYCDDTNDMVCQQCVSNGYAIDTNSNCTACNQLLPYCAECSDASTCTTCESTFTYIQSQCRRICNASLPNCVYCDDTNDMICQQCQTGYAIDSNSNCTACNQLLPYCAVCSDTSTCTSCENTFSYMQSRCRKICDASLPNCNYCDDMNDTMCQQCQTGFAKDNDDNCTACNQLMPYCAECSNTTNCTTCESTFSYVQSRCRKTCDASLPNCVYCDDTSDMVCQQCVSNGYAIDTNSNCTACNQLMPYCAECSDATTCTTCESTYGDIQSRCRKICDPSLPYCVYCDDASDMVCQQCVSNGYALDISNNCTACNELLPYCAECSDASTCTTCESTFAYKQSRCRKTCDASLPNCLYCADTNDTDCQQCLPGYTLFHGNCYECTDGNCNTCPVDPNVCTECDYGYFDISNCTACNTSMPFCANCSDGSNCTTCEDTFFLLDKKCRKTCDANVLSCVYCNETDSTTCEQCVPGIQPLGGLCLTASALAGNSLPQSGANTQAGQGLNAGAIAGISIGIIAGTVLAAGMVYLAASGKGKKLLENFRENKKSARSRNSVYVQEKTDGTVTQNGMNSIVNLRQTNLTPIE